MDARRPFEDEAVAAERAFARLAAREGIRTAFLAVLAEDAMVLGEGPELGRPAYEALPADFPGLLQWEPAVVGAAPDGTLAFTSGPYRLLGPGGSAAKTGVFFSVWRRHSGSSRLELVLDFGSKGASFPGWTGQLQRLRLPAAVLGTASLKGFLVRSLEQGRCPTLKGALHLGEPIQPNPLVPQGFHGSRDGTLGALWGARRRSDGTFGAFIIVLGVSDVGPVPVAFINA